jgi:hypothetical protein
MQFGSNAFGKLELGGLSGTLNVQSFSESVTIIEAFTKFVTKSLNTAFTLVDTLDAHKAG